MQGVPRSAATFARSVVMRRCMTATTNTFCRIIAPDVGHEWPEGRSNGGAQAQPHGHRCDEQARLAKPRRQMPVRGPDVPHPQRSEPQLLRGQYHVLNGGADGFLRTIASTRCLYRFLVRSAATMARIISRSTAISRAAHSTGCRIPWFAETGCLTPRGSTGNSCHERPVFD